MITTIAITIQARSPRMYLLNAKLPLRHRRRLSILGWSGLRRARVWMMCRSGSWSSSGNGWAVGCWRRHVGMRMENCLFWLVDETDDGGHASNDDDCGDDDGRIGRNEQQQQQQAMGIRWRKWSLGRLTTIALPFIFSLSKLFLFKSLFHHFREKVNISALYLVYLAKSSLHLLIFYM